MLPPLIMSRIVNRLRLAAGASVAVGELIEAAYYDRADGGPLNAERIVGIMIGRLRRRGFPIVLVGWGRGWRFAPTFREISPAALEPAIGVSFGEGKQKPGGHAMTR